jgi:hypothetical protein
MMQRHIHTVLLHLQSNNAKDRHSVDTKDSTLLLCRESKSKRVLLCCKGPYPSKAQRVHCTHPAAKPNPQNSTPASCLTSRECAWPPARQPSPCPPARLEARWGQSHPWTSLPASRGMSQQRTPRARQGRTRPPTGTRSGRHTAGLPVP